MRHLFVHRHNLSNHHTVPHKNAFKRLVKCFNATGGVTGTNGEKAPIAVTLENIARMESFFNEESHQEYRIGRLRIRY